MITIPKQIEGLLDDCVMRYPKTLRTPARILEDQLQFTGKSEIMALPMPYNFRPHKDDIPKLQGTQLVLYDYHYFLVDAVPGSEYSEFLMNVCRSYVALGYLPPAVISDVQGDKNTLKDEDVLVIAACKTSLAMAKTMYEKALSQFCKRFGI